MATVRRGVSATAGLRGATGCSGRGYRGHRRHRSHVGRAGRTIGGTGGIGAVVGGRLAEGVERFPARALRVFGPGLVGLRVAADGRVLRHERATGCLEALSERSECVAAVDLQAEVIDAGRAAGAGDREIDPRIVEHPLRVVGLAHHGFRAEQLLVEADAAGEVGDVEVHVETGHDVAPGLRGAQAATGPQSTAPAQQFSVRYASSASNWAYPA